LGRSLFVFDIIPEPSAAFGENTRVAKLITPVLSLSFLQLLTMGHEPPQVVSPPIFDYSGESAMSVHDSDLHYDRPPSIGELTQVEEKRERRGESVW